MFNFEQRRSGSRLKHAVVVSLSASTMSIYRFVFRVPGAPVEELGALSLRDDREAIAFGRSVVRDMVKGATPQQVAVMEVIDGERTIGRIGPDNSN
jgi:hypothetical protein